MVQEQEVRTLYTPFRATVLIGSSLRRAGNAPPQRHVLAILIPATEARDRTESYAVWF